MNWKEILRYVLIAVIGFLGGAGGDYATDHLTEPEVVELELAAQPYGNVLDAEAVEVYTEGDISAAHADLDKYKVVLEYEVPAQFTGGGPGLPDITCKDCKYYRNYGWTLYTNIDAEKMNVELAKKIFKRIPFPDAEIDNIVTVVKVQRE